MDPTLDDETRSRLSPAAVRRAPVEAAALAPGARVGAYVIERLIAQGGSARVYKAIDQTLGRPVALKVLDESGMDRSRERFLREVQLLAGFSHPHIVGLFAAGEADGVVFAAMELLPGSLADEVSRRGRLPWDEALRAARQACLGLDAALKRGIVHRDVKPSNLLRDESGAVKVSDFGLAKDLSSALELTLEGIVLGTPLYVSPEQGGGRTIDLRSDLYSLGASLFHLIQGRPPYHANTPLEIIVRHTVEPVPPLGDDVPLRVSQLVSRLLAKNPTDRPQRYDEAIELIDRALEAVDEPALPAAAPSRPSTSDALALSQLAAARAASEMGRTARAREMLDRLFHEHGSAWIDAGIELASLHERSGNLAESRTVLEAIVKETTDANVRARALWTLGTLYERESDAAIERAVEAYRRVLDVSDTLFPKKLLDARISRLRAKAKGASS